MRISIYPPSNGGIDRASIVIDGGRMELKDMTDEEAQAVLGLVMSAARRRFGGGEAVNTDPMARIAASFEAMVAKIPDENYAQKELAALRSRVFLTEEIRTSLKKAHGKLYEVLGMRDLVDLAHNLPYAARYISLADAIEALAREVEAHDAQVDA